MNIRNISDATEWFEVLQTNAQAQTAVMKLKPGGASGAKLNAHEQSTQVLVVLEGEVKAEVEDETFSLGKGDVVIVPAGVKHRFSNPGDTEAVTLSVYAPPEYLPDSKG